MNETTKKNNYKLVEQFFNQSISSGAVEKGSLKFVGRLPGDASSRSYYRVITNENRYVVCLEAKKEAMEASSNFILVGKTFQENGIRVPHIYDKCQQTGYILQEDLGDETLLKRFSSIDNIGNEYELLKETIENLFKIHSIKHNRYQKLPFSKLEFNKEKLMSEMIFSIKNFFINFLKHEVSDAEMLLMNQKFDDICNKLSDTKKVLCHRDYHSRNIMMLGKEMILIDFQDARMGIPQYDLVSILEDCYYKVSGKNIEKLKMYYFDNYLKEKNYQNSYDEFSYYYDLMAIQRIFKAVGSFSFFVSQKNDYRYLKYIGFAMEKLKEFLYKEKEFNNLRKLIFSHYYEN